MDLGQLTRHAEVRQARREIHRRDADTVREQLTIVSIPAPSHFEAERGKHLATRFREAGLRRVEVDRVGNVLGWVHAAGEAATRPPLIVAAHLDTVFPRGTDVTSREIEGRIHAPGITDNARGLAAIVTLARLIAPGTLPLRRPILLVGTVGEEGAGDLRGVKHLFRPESPLIDAHAFISLDGSGLRRIVHRAIGSRRLRADIRGQGGHSWSDWGIPNPILALGAAIAAISGIEVRRQPRSTLTVARIGGGTSVNAIPAHAWLEVDIRSESPEVLASLEESVRRVLAASVNAETGTSAGPPLRLVVTPIGDRPSGEAPPDSPLVRLAIEATRAVGAEPELVASSTDANVPLSVGIPAITIGVGGESGGIHTIEEWYENVAGPEGIERALLIILGCANEG